MWREAVTPEATQYRKIARGRGRRAAKAAEAQVRHGSSSLPSLIAPLSLMQAFLSPRRQARAISHVQ